MKVLVKYIVPVIALITGYLFGIWLLAPPTFKLQDESALVQCGLGYNYDMGQQPTRDTVIRLEQVVRRNCRKEYPPRATTNHRHTVGPHRGATKHAVLLNNGTCTINWELTPNAHLRAFEDICLHKEK
jgi:hypothetical protein